MSWTVETIYENYFWESVCQRVSVSFSFLSSPALKITGNTRRVHLIEEF